MVPIANIWASSERRPPIGVENVSSVPLVNTWASPAMKFE